MLSGERGQEKHRLSLDLTGQNGGIYQPVVWCGDILQEEQGNRFETLVPIMNTLDLELETILPI